MILQSPSLWGKIKNGDFLPQFCQQEQEMHIPPAILGDAAFPFESFLLKPFTNAVLTKQESYVNYRLSRARMVAKGAYGQLKGRWRLLPHKSEENSNETKFATLGLYGFT